MGMPVGALVARRLRVSGPTRSTSGYAAGEGSMARARALRSALLSQLSVLMAVSGR